MNINKQRVHELLEQDKRLDGRKLFEHRDISIETGLSINAEGTARVRIGKTEVIVGVKMDTQEPYTDHEDEGTMVVGMEFSPTAGERYESGPPRIDAIEVARVVDRGIRESGFIDFDKLCIKAGEKVWNVYVDLYAVNDAGNLMDVAALAALVALANAKIPYLTAEEKIDKEKGLSKDSLPLNKDAMAFNITLHKIGDQIVVDPISEEEEISDYRISLAVCSNNGKARITSMQKGKEGAITSEEMEKILNLVELKFEEMYLEIQKKVFKS